MRPILVVRVDIYFSSFFFFSFFFFYFFQLNSWSFQFNFVEYKTGILIASCRLEIHLEESF